MTIVFADIESCVAANWRLAPAALNSAGVNEIATVLSSDHDGLNGRAISKPFTVSPSGGIGSRGNSCVADDVAGNFFADLATKASDQLGQHSLWIAVEFLFQGRRKFCDWRVLVSPRPS